MSLAPEVTELTWQRLMDPAATRMHLLGAYGDAAPDAPLTGIVHFLFHRSTWTAGEYCYLQDLFVVPQARGRHIGRALIEAVYAAADREQAGRVYWLTHETNYPGRSLYDKVATNAGFIQYRR